MSFLSLLFSVAVAATDPAVQALDKMQQAWNQSKTFQAEFRQVILSKRLGTTEETTGTISIVRPNQLRWESSEGNIQILNKNTFTNVKAPKRKRKRVVDIFKNASKVVDARSLNFLADKVKFKDLYRPELAGEKPNIIELKLVPRKTGDESYIAEIDKGSYLLRALTTDSSDSRVRLEFSNIKTNEPLKDELFEIKPTADDIVHTNS